MALLSLQRQQESSFLVDWTLHQASGELTQAGVANDLVVAHLPAKVEGTVELAELVALLRDYPTIVYERVWSIELARELRAALPGAVLVRLVGEHDTPEAPADHVCRGDAARLVAMLCTLAGLPPPASGAPAYRPNLRPRVVPAGARGLPRAFPIQGNAGCSHRADARDNPRFAGLDLPAGVGRGCSFCVTGRAYQSRPRAEVLGSVLEQLRYLRRAAPEIQELALRDQCPFGYLEELCASAAREQLGPFTLLLESRADWLLRHERELCAALATAERSAIRLAPFLVGIESFSQDELDRFNKGLRVETAVALLARLRQWHVRFPHALDLSRSAWGFILFTPWTTPGDLRVNLDAMRATRFDELRGHVLLSRLRLYPDTALYYLAERDGLLGQPASGRADDTSERYGYHPGAPWHHADAAVARIAELAPLLLERRAGRDELAILGALLELSEAASAPGELTVEAVERRLALATASLRPAARAPCFRDAGAAGDERRRLRLELARLLVSAPTLPVELPLFGTRLLDVEARDDALWLVLGQDAPLARLRLWRPSVGGAVEVRGEPGPQAPEELCRELPRMAARLRRALGSERWARAWPVARQLCALPPEAPRAQQRQLVEGVQPRVGLVRGTFRCNQDCVMCWQDRRWPSVDAAQLGGWLEDLRAAGAESLIVSGGEPTLDPGLPAMLARARALGFGAVTLETNAVLAGRDGLGSRLRDAGLTAALVSLHSGEPAVSDALTRAPGTHGATLRGVEALLAAGLQVGLNAVLTGTALATLVELPRFVARSFGRSLALGLTLSYPVAPFARARLREVLPEPTRLRALLAQTIEQACAEGLALRGLDGPCGPPLCAFAADRRVTAGKVVPAPVGFRRHASACARCAVRAACFGVSDDTLALFGEGCVLPVAVRPDGPEETAT